MEQFIETYESIKERKPFNFRTGLRHLALSGLVLKDRIEGIDKFLDTPRIQFLYIHHSFKDELIRFDKLMKKLSANHTFISYGEAVEKIINKSIDKPYISFSSDDGFKNNLLAGEILNNYGAKACFFINPGLIGENNFGRIKSHCRDKLHLLPVEFLNWDDVYHLMEQGHEIGGHTMFHDNMAGMTDLELKEDLTETYNTIEVRCGKAEHFAFPYGRFHHFNEMARKAVFAAGFISCASAERGCHFNETKMVSKENLCIRRDHVILDWDLGQILYFIANNVRQKDISSDVFPYKQI